MTNISEDNKAEYKRLLATYGAGVADRYLQLVSSPHYYSTDRKAFHQKPKP